MTIADRLRDVQFGAFVIALPEPLRGQVDTLRMRFDTASAKIAPSHITVTRVAG